MFEARDGRNTTLWRSRIAIPSIHSAEEDGGCNPISGGLCPP